MEALITYQLLTGSPAVIQKCVCYWMPGLIIGTFSLRQDTVSSRYDVKARSSHRFFSNRSLPRD